MKRIKISISELYAIPSNQWELIKALLAGKKVIQRESLDRDTIIFEWDDQEKGGEMGKENDSKWIPLEADFVILSNSVQRIENQGRELKQDFEGLLKRFEGLLSRVEQMERDLEHRKGGRIHRERSITEVEYSYPDYPDNFRNTMTGGILDC